MDPTDPTSLARLSESISALAARAAPSLVAIRVGPNKHVTGTLWRGDLVVTSDQALPAQDSFTVMLANGSLALARPGQRDPAANLALLHLGVTVGIAPPAAGVATVGGLVLALGAEADASPVVRLTLIQRLLHNQLSDAPTIVLDLTGAIDQGGPVLDAYGGTIGIAAIGPHNETVVVPHGAIARLIDGVPIQRSPSVPTIEPAPLPVRSHANSGRRGWLGVALQPITVPEPLVTRAGQVSGRMVMNLTPGGPAERAGLRVGDVLLSLDGHSASGSNALRAFMGSERIGAQIEVRVLRDGAVMMAHVVVAEQPIG